MAPIDERCEVVADGLLRISDASKFLGLSRSKLYQLMDRGELPFTKIGRSRRVPRKAVVEFAASRTVGTELR